MNLAVIIPAYNHAEDVLIALNSLHALRATSKAHKIAFHVQDDASPAGPLSAVVPPLLASVARNPENLGFAGNCNAGAAHRLLTLDPTPDVLFFINQDVYAVPEWSDGWEDALMRGFDDPSVGIVGPRLLFPSGEVQSVGGVFDAIAQPAHRCLGWGDPHAAEVETPRLVDWTTGAAIAVRTDLFRELDGFNPAYARGYFEDVDLCLRARERGYSVRVEPACTLIHRPGSSGGSPYFAINARRFYDEWIATGKVKPGTAVPQDRFW